MTNPLTLVTPTAGVTVWPKTRADWQQKFHQVALAAVPLLVLAHMGTQSAILAALAIIFAAVDPILSYSNSPDDDRKIIYGLGGLLQFGLVTFGVLDANTAAAWVGAGITFLTSVLAQDHTPTSTLVPVSSAGTDSA